MSSACINIKLQFEKKIPQIILKLQSFHFFNLNIKIDLME